MGMAGIVQGNPEVDSVLKRRERDTHLLLVKEAGLGISTRDTWNVLGDADLCRAAQFHPSWDLGHKR